MLRENEFLEKTPETSPETQALIATEISYYNSHLAEWCKRAGRVLREKTAGSAARLFLQIDSIVAQRGAIPKILMIAERIMEHFYSRLPAELPRYAETVRVRRNFAAILEPLANVTSQPLMGLVAIPIRYAFALHLVVPQLWHEVGQYVFWAEYSPQVRPHADWNFSLRNHDESPSRTQTEAFAVAFHLRADMFADVLVYCFGFGGSLEKFFLYLASLTANVAKHDSLHRLHWDRQALMLVHRLYFVAHFAAVQRRAKREAPATRREFTRICKTVDDAYFANSQETEQMVRQVIGHLNRISDREGWPEAFPIPPNIAPTVVRNFKTKVYEICREDLRNLAYAFRNLTLDGRPALLGPSNWEQIERGELVDLASGEDLLAAYREFYVEEVEALLAGARSRRDGQFRKMATLGRSALLHIYQSESGAA
jgi:hypothetical protein